MESILPEFTSYSFGTSYGGYGICNIGFAKYSQRLGSTVYFHNKYAPKRESNEWAILSDEEKKIFDKPFKKCKIGISGTTPFEFHENESEIKVAMTMAESNKIGEDWVEACELMDYIIVPNAFYKKVFEDSGVTKPVLVFRSGIDIEKYGYHRRTIRNDWTFGLCGYLNDRKSVLETIQAFTSEFEAKEPVRLKLHTSNKAFAYYKNFNDPRITVTSDHKTFDEIIEFYNSLDVFVFPSKAEGIGLPPREAMATGLPVILTNYSGLEDIASGIYSYPLNDYELTERTDMLEQPGMWAKPNIQELMYWMRHTYENKEESRQKGLLASSIMRGKYSWESCSKNILDFLGGIA